jgi:hypothetical protein
LVFSATNKLTLFFTAGYLGGVYLIVAMTMQEN